MVVSLIVVFAFMESGGFIVTLNQQIEALLERYMRSSDSNHNRHNRARQVKALCLEESIRVVADIEMESELKYMIVNKLTDAFGVNP